MPRFHRRTTCLTIAAVVLAGCNDAAPLAAVADTPPRHAADLSLVLPEGDALKGQYIDGGTTATPLSPNGGPGDIASRDSSPAGARTTFASQADDNAIITNATTKAFFMKANGGTVAVGEGYMQFFATNAENRTGVSVSTPSGGLLNATQTGGFSQIIPTWQTLVTYARLPLTGDCGYSVLASTDHRAWQTFPFPPFSVFGNAVANSYSGLESLPACPTGIAITGTGGEGDSRITDSQWQICYWLVWYDSTGVELYREFLYCTTL